MANVDVVLEDKVPLPLLRYSGGGGSPLFIEISLNG